MENPKQTPTPETPRTSLPELPEGIRIPDSPAGLLEGGFGVAPAGIDAASHVTELASPTFAVDSHGVATQIRAEQPSLYDNEPVNSFKSESVRVAAQKTAKVAKEIGGKVADKARNLSAEDMVAAGTILVETSDVYRHHREKGKTWKQAAVKAGKHATLRTVEYKLNKKTGKASSDQDEHSSREAA